MVDRFFYDRGSIRFEKVAPNPEAQLTVSPKPCIAHYSSFHVLFHYPHITPMYYPECSLVVSILLFHYPQTTPMYNPNVA